MGGVIGKAENNASVKQCIILGTISSNGENNVGAIIGGADYALNVTDCLWDEKINYSCCGNNKDVGKNSVFTFNSSYIINDTNGTSLIDFINRGVTEGSNFSRWYLVEFNCNGGTAPGIEPDNKGVFTKLIIFTSEKELPEPTKSEHKFAGWFLDSNLTIPVTNKEKNIETLTIYAKYYVNNYTVTFDYENGTKVNKSFGYNKTINLPETPIREGCEFVRWDTNYTSMPNKDITIIAVWDKIASGIVEIVFDLKSVGDKDVEKIISKYTNEIFTTERIVKNDETGEIKVIISFKEPEATINFVEAIKGSNDPDIKAISFLSEALQSFCATCELTQVLFFTIFALFQNKRGEGKGNKMI